MPDAPQPDRRTATIARCLSLPRLGPYLSATHGNVKDALRLYQWNVDLSGAVYEVLHVFEVLLRNAIDGQLTTWNARQTDRRTGSTHTADWTRDPSRLLGRLVGPDLQKARSRARRALRAGRPEGRAPAHPDVLAQLTLGTWRFLLPDNDPGRQLLWTQAVRHAFPHLSRTPAELVTEVDGIYRLRNRVAHLEPLLRSDRVRGELTAIRHVTAAIEPVTEQWLTSRQRVTAVLRARPHNE